MSAIESKQAKQIVARDGVTLAYEVIGSGPKLLILANGLGGRLYAWEPLLEEFFREYRIVTWDYRGIFESSSPEAICRLSVRDQAEDGVELMRAEGADSAVWFGWSFGVQVALEIAAVHPSAVAGLVLLNGTYGHVFSSVFQPGFRLASLPRYIHDLLEFLQEHPEAASLFRRVSKATTVTTLGLFTLLHGRKAFELRPLLEQYTSDIFQADVFVNYLRLFQELDAHSAYHHLRDICAPALILSGRWDLLTPPRQSRDMARKLRKAEHVHIKNGSHFLLVEKPEIVLPAIREFLEKRAEWTVPRSCHPDDRREEGPPSGK